jgi:ferredoxin-fold anticodon binding domain-containing protein
MIIFTTQRKQRKTAIINTIMKKRKTGGNKEMKELATRFIGQECIVHFFDGSQQMGIIKDVTEGAILLEKKEKLEAINLDFVLRIKEAPRSKK